MRLQHVTLLAGAALVVGPFLEPFFPVLRRATVPVLPRGADPLRVLHVSDLHLLPRHGRRSTWLRGLAALQPDLVVSTGDHLSSAAAIPLLAASLGALTADGTPGVFVPGNNDYYTPTRPSVLGYVKAGPPRRRGPDLPWADAARALAVVGWTDLTHRRTTISVRGLPVTLTGTDDAHLQRDRYERVAGPVDGFAIGVTHTPQRRVLDAFAGDGHRLLLAGHTHGGQVRLPAVGALVTNCDLDRARARGLSRHGDAWLHVSAGMGTSPYAPVRLCCRPEATLLTLVESGSLAT
jgi:predicted MPP superfamily phosphohydrolase